MKVENVTSKYDSSFDYFEHRTLYCENCETIVGKEYTDDGNITWNIDLKYNKCPHCGKVLLYEN